jgi:hypothetical protein
MKSLKIGALAVTTILCLTPVSLRWSRGDESSLFSISAVSDTTEAADLNLSVRHYRSAGRFHHRGYARLYNPYCNGPYTGGGWNGGTYYGGPWMDLHCYYGAVY